MAGKPQPGSLASEAARLSIALGGVVTVEKVRWMKKRGYDLEDIPTLKRKLKNQERGQIKDKPADAAKISDPSPPPIAETLPIEAELGKLQAKLLLADNYDDARTIRMQIAGVKDVIKTLREQEYYVTKESQIRRGLQSGQVIKQLILRMPSELPQMTIGLDYADNVKKTEDYAFSMLTEISNAETYNR